MDLPLVSREYPLYGHGSKVCDTYRKLLPYIPQKPRSLVENAHGESQHNRASYC